VIFLQGPSGTGKSYIAIYSALELLKERKIDKIIYIRTAVESASKSIGFLKGDLADKFSEYSVVLNSKLQESTDSQTVHALTEQEYIKAMPVNFARGLTFNKSLVIFDEIQSATRAEITTILTRFGRGSKFLLLGDVRQSDIRDSGFETVYNLFDTEFSRKNNIHCMKFDTGDIIRSQLLKHITQILGV
jgi:phosphate starvation-inducible PhoH-like protein